MTYLVGGKLMDKKRILVIDDEPSVARVISLALSAANIEHVLDHCADGAQGRIKAAHGEYDLIALDLAMPLMDGVTALAEMKQNPKSAPIPVVVITGTQDPALQQQVMDLGAAALIAKPFQVQDITNTFTRVLAGERVESGQGGIRPLGT
jgi:CheY-like chemotaxis protein